VIISIIVIVSADVECRMSMGLDVQPLYLCDFLENKFSGRNALVLSTITHVQQSSTTEKLLKRPKLLVFKSWPQTTLRNLALPVMKWRNRKKSQFSVNKQICKNKNQIFKPWMLSSLNELIRPWWTWRTLCGNVSFVVVNWRSITELFNYIFWRNLVVTFSIHPRSYYPNYVAFV